MTIGIDIGGTNIKAATIENNDIVGDIMTRETPKNLEGLRSVVVEIIRDLVGDSDTKIGIAVPGLIAGDGEKMVCSPNLPFLDGMNLCDILPGFAIKYGNDADMALLGEIAIGNLYDEKVLLLTLGTGIGSAFYINGTGSWQIGQAGEFGHMKVVPNGRPCPCGGFGCIESYFSGRAILAEGQKNISPAPEDVKEVFSLAKNGDEKAIEIIKSGIDKLGLAVANAINLIGVNRIIISGNISESYDYFIHDLEESISQNTFTVDSRDIKIKKSKVIGKAAIIGAVQNISAI